MLIAVQLDEQPVSKETFQTNNLESNLPETMSTSWKVQVDQTKRKRHQSQVSENLIRTAGTQIPQTTGTRVVAIKIAEFEWEIK